MNTQITHRQHYIPRSYLNGFSYCENMIYVYDVVKEKQLENQVPIKSICFQKDLYEVWNKNSELILPNYLENVLSAIENNYTRFINKLTNYSKDNNIRDYKFEQDEIKLLINFITTLILRDPTMIELVKDNFKSYFNGIDDIDASNLARKFCLPFFNIHEYGDMDVALYARIASPMLNMKFTIFHDNTGNLITCDNPVYISSSNRLNLYDYDEIVFPLSKKFCLFVEKDDVFDKHIKNTVIKNYAIECVSKSARNSIYSSYKFNKKEIDNIKTYRYKKIIEKSKLYER